MKNRTNYFRKPYWARLSDAETGTLPRPNSETDVASADRPQARTAALRVSDPVRKADPEPRTMASPEQPRDGYLTTTEAAAFLRLSPRTLERYRVEGGGPRFLKAGRGKRARVLYREEDLITWLESVSFTTTSEY